MDELTARANATFCATLVDQWIAEGLTAAFISPGSRSTPLAVALAERSELRIDVFHDERPTSFAALGHGLATGTPAVTICTSGTAGAHFFAAVIEADLAAVPMIVCTADRPPELWDRGAPQTVDQTELFGNKVRSFVEPGPPEDGDPNQWRPIAQRAWGAATHPKPGPVHMNLSFREPLLGQPGPLPQAITERQSPAGSAPDQDVIADLATQMAGRRGVIVAGRNQSDPRDLHAIASQLKWPLLADHRSGCRSPEASHVISRFDSLLRDQGFAQAHKPEFVLRVGEIVTSKAVSKWLTASQAQVVASRPFGRLIDPEDIADITIDELGLVRELSAALDGVAEAPSQWLESWRSADADADDAITSTLAAAPALNEVAIARQVVGAAPTGGALVVASSMPVRDVEWFGPDRNDILVISNRGANGIDGTVATAIGVARTGLPTICLLGDVAFVHDATSLAALSERDLDLTIVVIDNRGGGIFSFLPQRDLLGDERYEQLFGTPHHADLAALARAHQVAVTEWPADLAPNGVNVVVAHTDRSDNRALHDSLVDEVAARIDRGRSS